MANICVRSIRAAARAAACGGLLLSAAASASAQDAKSPDIVKQLTQILDAKKLDSIAAPDPQAPGMYVGALYFPGSQLLLVPARDPAPPPPPSPRSTRRRRFSTRRSPRRTTARSTST